MKSQNSNLKFLKLRRKYPRFVYESFNYGIKNNDLKIVFNFSIGPGIRFFPEIIVKNIDTKLIKRVGEAALNNLIFHAGLIEIPSYWKATCSPLIEIRAGALTEKQISWWKNLFLDGLGQFYYENRINWKIKDFLKISSCGKEFSPYCAKLSDRYLVPFAGGRDSIVTLESLKKKQKEIALFTVNPIEKIQKTVRVSGIKKQIIVRRTIDKKLLEMNKRGYFNGHTPFTSFLSFAAVLCAVIFDYKNIVFSNEKSAEEGNIEYLGKVINHQWAKTLKFEKMFRNYCRNFLAKDVDYYSFLRKYTELEISKALTKYPKYFPVFSSCNAGMKIGQETLSLRDRWCGNCPKCLFVYMTLYPFLKKRELDTIFSKDIFENKKLLPVMKQLTGDRELKPFECVGTKKEGKKAFELCLNRAKKEGKVPFLLK